MSCYVIVLWPKHVTNHIRHKQINIALRNEWLHPIVGYSEPCVIYSYPT